MELRTEDTAQGWGEKGVGCTWRPTLDCNLQVRLWMEDGPRAVMTLLVDECGNGGPSFSGKGGPWVSSRKEEQQLCQPEGLLGGSSRSRSSIRLTALATQQTVFGQLAPEGTPDSCPVRARVPSAVMTQYGGRAGHMTMPQQSSLGSPKHLRVLPLP